MHEMAIPLFEADDAVLWESKPTICRSPRRRASRKGATWPAWNGSPTMCPRAVPLA